MSLARGRDFSPSEHRLVALLRHYLLPLGALLLVKATEISAQQMTVRVIETVFGFVALVLLLSGLNATVFQGAPEGSWRKRIPGIFLDVARFALIGAGLAVILSYVWGRMSAVCSALWE